VLGTIRTLFLAPIAGDLIAVLIELPVILTFAWILCARLIKRFEVSNDLASRASMGAIAFALLMCAELALSLWLFGNSITGYSEHFRTAHGAVGLAGQITFAVFPVLQLRQSR
jgi:hypothetical protein